jgi:hypothetical protein
MPTARLATLMDLALAAWVCAWIAIGVVIGIEVSHLSALSKTVVKEGLAVHTVGTSLRGLGGLPLVGGPIASGAKAVQAAGSSAVASGTASESTVSALSVLLALAVAVLPSLPVLVFYLPARLKRRRESATIRRALGDPHQVANLRDFLAARALATLDYNSLSRLGVRGGAALSEDELTALAEEQLRRMDIDPQRLRIPMSNRA